jgi:hypothetical protein
LPSDGILPRRSGRLKPEPLLERHEARHRLSQPTGQPTPPDGSASAGGIGAEIRAAAAGAALAVDLDPAVAHDQADQLTLRAAAAAACALALGCGLYEQCRRYPSSTVASSR